MSHSSPQTYPFADLALDAAYVAYRLQEIFPVEPGHDVPRPTLPTMLKMLPDELTGISAPPGDECKWFVPPPNPVYTQLGVPIAESKCKQLEPSSIKDYLTLAYIGMGPCNLVRLTAQLCGLALLRMRGLIEPDKVTFHIFDVCSEKDIGKGVWREGAVASAGLAGLQAGSGPNGLSNSPIEEISVIYEEKQRHSIKEEVPNHVMFAYNQQITTTTRIPRAHVGDSFHEYYTELVEWAKSMGFNIESYPDNELIDMDMDENGRLTIEMRKPGSFGPGKPVSREGIPVPFDWVSFPIGHFDEKPSPKSPQGHLLIPFMKYDKETGEYDSVESRKAMNKAGIALNSASDELARAGFTTYTSPGKPEMHNVCIGRGLTSFDVVRNLYTELVVPGEPDFYAKGLNDEVVFPEDTVPTKIDFVARRGLSPIRTANEMSKTYVTTYLTSEMMRAMQRTNGGRLDSKLAKDLLKLEHEHIHGKALTDKEFSNPPLSYYDSDQPRDMYVQYLQSRLDMCKTSSEEDTIADQLRTANFMLIGALEIPNITGLADESEMHRHHCDVIASCRTSDEVDQYTTLLRQYVLGEVASAQPQSGNLVLQLAKNKIITFEDYALTDFELIPEKEWVDSTTGEWDQHSTRVRNKTTGKEYHSMVLATGFGKDIQNYPTPLIKNLVDKGIITPDPRSASSINTGPPETAFGLYAADADGKPNTRLMTGGVGASLSTVPQNIETLVYEASTTLFDPLITPVFDKFFPDAVRVKQSHNSTLQAEENERYHKPTYNQGLGHLAWRKCYPGTGNFHEYMATPEENRVKNADYQSRLQEYHQEYPFTSYTGPPLRHKDHPRGKLTLSTG